MCSLNLFEGLDKTWRLCVSLANVGLEQASWVPHTGLACYTLVLHNVWIQHASFILSWPDIHNIVMCTFKRSSCNVSMYLSEPWQNEWMCRNYVTGSARIDHLSTKNHWFLARLLYHNLITIYTTTTKSLSLLQNLMGFLLQLTEMG